MADAGAGIAFRSIAALGRDYRRGALSPTAVVEACLQRIDRDDGQLNAIVSTLAESARADAARAEEELAAGRDLGPLHGIPVGIKDLVDIAGTVTGFGSDPVFAAPATRDAAMVVHLREAGAVLIAKTNLLEFAYGAVNPRIGQTNNPWDTARTAGGSSGGSAAAVAAGLCYAAVGTDTGGSIRIPAAYCGAVGLKPTYGLVPLAGVSMLSWSLDHAGPIARSCADAAAFLGGLTGTSVDASPASLRGLRFGLIAALRDYDATTPGVRAGMDSACAVLRDAGAAIEEVEIEALSESAEALLHVLLPEASVILGRLLDSHADALAEQTRAQLEFGFALPATAHVRAQQFRRFLGERFLDCLDRFDALLSPGVPWEAPAEDPAIDGAEGYGEMLCSAPTNLCGLPSLVLPCGRGEDGMPVSLQLIGSPDSDERLLQIGAALEPAFLLGPPPGYGSSLSAAEGLG